MLPQNECHSFLVACCTMYKLTEFQSELFIDEFTWKNETVPARFILGI